MSFITIEYGFADESRRPLNTMSHTDATVAVQEFPWEEQLALFNHGHDRVGPEVCFIRRTTKEQEEPEDVEAYASIAKVEDGTWLIVAGSRMPGLFLWLFPTTKVTDIIMDSIAWQDVQRFIQRFYQDSRADLFAWMKEHG